MLILSRRASEEVLINGVILVKVLSIRRDRVKLGISAPKGVGIVRRELIRLATNRDSQVRPRRKAPPRTPSVNRPARRAS